MCSKSIEYLQKKNNFMIYIVITVAVQGEVNRISNGILH